MFVVLFLDTQHRFIAYAQMFHDTNDSASVYPCKLARRRCD